MYIYFDVVVMLCNACKNAILHLYFFMLYKSYIDRIIKIETVGNYAQKVASVKKQKIALGEFSAWRFCEVIRKSSSDRFIR